MPGIASSRARRGGRPRARARARANAVTKESPRRSGRRPDDRAFGDDSDVSETPACVVCDRTPPAIRARFAPRGPRRSTRRDSFFLVVPPVRASLLLPRRGPRPAHFSSRPRAFPSPPSVRVVMVQVGVAASEDEARVRAIGEVVQAMIDAVRDGRSINLNAVKNEAARARPAQIPQARRAHRRRPRRAPRGVAPAPAREARRTASGIAVVAVMSKPHRCPHIATTGNICVYCLGGPDSDFEYSTQSYTGYEPTSMRAIRAGSPYVQARGRVDQLRKLGHEVDKVIHPLGLCPSPPTTETGS